MLITVYPDAWVRVRVRVRVITVYHDACIALRITVFALRYVTIEGLQYWSVEP